MPEVTDEEYEAILKSEAIQNEANNRKKSAGIFDETPKNKRAAEGYLEACAIGSLILAIAALIVGIVLAVKQEQSLPFWIGFLVADAYVAGWAVLKVVCNISNNLHDLNEKTRR